MRHIPVTVTTNETAEFLNYMHDSEIKKVNIQLMKEDIEYPSRVVEFVRNNGLKVVSFHTPFMTNGKALLIEDFNVLDDLEISLHIINGICNALSISDIPVVCHSELTADELYRLDPIITNLNRCLLLCDCIKLCIENVPMYNIYLGSDMSKVVTYTPAVVRYLRQHLLDAKVYTCLDVCHAMMFCRYIQVLSDAGMYEGKTISLEHFFKEHGSLCGLIHLANCKNFGIGSDHGVSFETHEEIMSLMKAIRKHINNAPIVLEISEKDYTNRINVKKTVKLLIEGDAHV